MQGGRHPRWISGVVLTLLLVGAAGVAVAADRGATDKGIPVPVIVVVDPQVAMTQSKAGQAVRGEYDGYRRSFQEELDSGRKGLTETENELLRQKAVMTQSAWQKKSREFDKRVVAFNQRIQKANLAVEKSYRAAMAELARLFATVAADVANEVGATLVLPSQQVVMHDPRMDITAAVVDRMNSRYPTIKFPPPVLDGLLPSVSGPQPESKK